MFKVGDEVLVKVKITEVEKGVPYPIRGEISETNLSLCFSEQELIPVGKTYENGLADAWKLAKKIALETCDGGMNCNDIEDIFGKGAYCVFKDFTYEEALAKIEAYEREKEIRVGDVVKSGISRGVITRIEGDSVSIIYESGANGWANKRYCTKTGKHIDIEAVLRQIGE